MSWWGGGEMREMPGIEWRVLAMILSTLNPGSCPPSPGLAPWAILICISSALTRYSVVTPNRPEATCLIAERAEVPSSRGAKRAESSPPSPVLERAPMVFIAIARASWASRDIEPNDMAPVTNRRMMSSMGSTSSRGIGVPFLKSKKSRMKMGLGLLSTRDVNSLNFL